MISISSSFRSLIQEDLFICRVATSQPLENWAKTWDAPGGECCETISSCLPLCLCASQMFNFRLFSGPKLRMSLDECCDTLDILENLVLIALTHCLYFLPVSHIHI